MENLQPLEIGCNEVLLCKSCGLTMYLRQRQETAIITTASMVVSHHRYAHHEYKQGWRKPLFSLQLLILFTFNL